MIPFGEYTPDQPIYDNAGSSIIKNVLPRTSKSYGPLASLSSISDALTNRAQGAGAFRDSGGDVHTFCGDVSNLFKLNGTAWDEISKSTGGYTTAADAAVNFVQFGQNIIAANGHSDAIQSYVLGSSSKFADLAATAPRARHLAVIKDFVFAANTWDSTDGAVPNRVWWPTINDPTDWPTIGSTDAAQKQSDRQDLPVGGWIQAITGAIGGMDGAIFLENAIYRVQYEGPPHVFGFYEVERDRGTPAPNSVVNVGAFGFYLGEDGFYSFSGAGSTPIGNQRIDKTFFTDLDQNHFHRIYGAADPVNKMVFWAYPGEGNTDGRPNKAVIYNWAVDRWSYAELECDVILRDLTPGYTLEELDAFGDVDSLPFSLDSRVWTGGRLALSAFDSDKKLARFAGSNMAATLDCIEYGGSILGDPSQRVFVDAVRPYVDGGTVTITHKHRDTLDATPTEVGPNAIDGDGQAHFTVSSRYAREQVNIAAGGTWTHAQGVDIEATLDGAV